MRLPGAVHSCGSFSAFVTGQRWIFAIEHIFYNLSVPPVSAVLVRVAEFDSPTLNLFFCSSTSLTNKC